MRRPRQARPAVAGSFILDHGAGRKTEHPALQHLRLHVRGGKGIEREGYAVDIVSYGTPGFEPRKHYDFYLGHGGHTRSILDVCRRHIRHALRVQLLLEGIQPNVTGTLRQFSCRRKGLPPVRSFARSIDDTEEEENEAGEEYLARRADAAFLSGPRTVATFKGVSRNMSLLYLASYVEKDLLAPDRNFEAGRTNFFVCGWHDGQRAEGFGFAD